MIIESLHIDGFGRLVDCGYEFRPGLNLIVGPNESGKTTLRACVAALLYGMKRDDVKRAKYEDEYERYLPWEGVGQAAAGAGVRYSGRLAYRLTSGPFEVFRIFSKDSEQCIVTDLSSGRDVTNSFSLSSNRERLFAHQHLGVSKAVFRATAFISLPTVRQVGAGQQSAHLLGELAGADGGAVANVELQRALKRLQAAIDSIGTDKKVVHGYGAALNRRDALREEYEGIKKKREAMEGDQLEAERLRGQLEQHGGEIRHFRRLRGRLQAYQLRQQLDRAEALQRDCGQLRAQQESLRAYETFPTHLQAVLEKHQQALAHLAREGAALTERLTAIEAQLTAAAAALEEYPGLAELPADYPAQLAVALERWRTACQHHQRAADARAEAQAKLGEARAEARDMAERFGESSPEAIQRHLDSLDRAEQSKSMRSSLLEQITRREVDQRHTVRSGRRWSSAGVLLAAFGIVHLAYALISASEPWAPAGIGAGLIAAAWFCFTAVRRAQLSIKRCMVEIEELRQPLTDEVKTEREEREKITAWCEQISVSNAEELRSAVERWESLGHRARDLEQAERDQTKQADEAVDVVQRAEVELAALLSQQPQEDQNSDWEGLAAQEQERFNRWQQLSGEEQRLNRDRDNLQSELQQREAASSDAEAALAAVCSEAGVSTVAEFSKRYALAEQWQLVRSELEHQEALLAECLGTDTLADIRERAAQIEDEPGQETAPPELDAEALDARLAQLDGEAAGTANDFSRVEERIRLALHGSRELAEVEEDLHQAAEEVAELDQTRQALLLARDTIENSAEEFHGRIGPALRGALTRLVRANTRGRYADLLIDDDFNVQVRAPEKGTYVPSGWLSTGTADLLPLLLRLALVEVFAQSGEPLPIFLDEVLVNLDAGRFAATVDLLVEFGRAHQVFYFTCHPEQAERLTRQASNVIELSIDT